MNKFWWLVAIGCGYASFVGVVLVQVFRKKINQSQKLATLAVYGFISIFVIILIIIGLVKLSAK